MKFYSMDGEVVLKTGWSSGGFSDWLKHTVDLADGEQVIGYKSRSNPDYPNCPWHFDFQLIIGRLI